ncbi:hypothetical protein GUITHDRAFT_107547 [Guillardia theta CCMP2712]|uniref:CS domain-containing protein n=1 Tax=Guillardia theta (strain CCMP2712) TaxID=905079 RepID=L1JF86_GUITC|nr:hypothetical protein GUITHDRAFT_107547 [Guillardia theta CCMP2712]EKX46774.1 hypothetical protein GUITHDRAFT_107547 [Guillardia theta CCMP2712]|eukprot:XP_005833754.1 hypothetical protein GUITHDRAFT_107547 [Guillardia theta CCMP2712]
MPGTEEALEAYKLEEKRRQEEGRKDEDTDGRSQEEKIEWLRSRGVVIETPEDRRKAAAQQKQNLEDPAPGKRISFKYVKVPADPNLPCEEIQGEGPEARDNFLTMLKSVFAGGKIDATAAQRAAAQHLGASAQPLGSEGLSTLDQAASEGVVETFALVRPAKSNSHCGVYIYLDEVGLLKQLPKNERACGIAKSCGFDNAEFYGDVFIGRTQVQPAPMRNVDFPLSDIDSAAPWLRRAATENYEYGLAMREVKDALEAKGVQQTVNDDDEHDCGGYKWSQDSESVEILLEVPQAASSKDVKVKFSSQKVTTTVKGEEVLSLDLFDKIRPDECNWTFSKATALMKVSC